MKVTPLASDSMGVRSTATLVETGEHRIVFDPGAALAPNRFELPPSEIEKATLKHIKSDIAEAVKTCDIIVISHYHHDHFNPRANFYKGKIIFTKSWKANINYSQRTRAVKLKNKFERLKPLPNVTVCDDTRHVIDDGLELIFSHAVPHGQIGTKIGYVVMTAVREDDYTFMYCSDISGPVEPSTAELIIAAQPDLVYIDGPPTNLLEKQLTHEDLEKAINNILDIITFTGAMVILDHHLLRDKGYRTHLNKIYEHNSRVQTAAEYLGKPNKLLEATRDVLWKNGGDVLGKNRKTQ